MSLLCLKYSTLVLVIIFGATTLKSWLWPYHYGTSSRCVLESVHSKYVDMENYKDDCYSRYPLYKYLKQRDDSNNLVLSTFTNMFSPTGHRENSSYFCTWKCRKLRPSSLFGRQCSHRFFGLFHLYASIVKKNN